MWGVVLCVMLEGVEASWKRHLREHRSKNPLQLNSTRAPNTIGLNNGRAP
jgi:hypothetical protein